MKIFLGISSYSDETTSNERIEIIRKSLESLQKIRPKNLDVIIFVDGGMTKKHQEVLIDSGFQYRFVKKNLGIGNTKSFCIKYFLDNKYQYGFLADDDVTYIADPFTAYINAMKIAKINHLCFMPHRFRTPNGYSEQKRTPVYVNGMVLHTTGIVCGIFLSITPQLIEKIGFFRVLPYRYGGEHEDFSRRASLANSIGDVCLDLPDSDKYIQFGEEMNDYKACKIDIKLARENVKIVLSTKVPYISFPMFNLEQYFMAERSIVIVINYNGENIEMNRLIDDINKLEYKNLYVLINCMNKNTINLTTKYITRFCENNNYIAISKVKIVLKPSDHIDNLTIETISRAH